MVQTDIILILKDIKISVLKPENFLSLEPLANDKNIWTYNPSFADPADFKIKWFDKALSQMQAGKRIAFYVEYQKQPAGSSSYYDLEDDQLTIGYTWFAAKFWGSGLNQTVKFLMLEYAFEKMQMEKINFKVDSINNRSWTALEKLGAKNTKIIENDLMMPDGRMRTTKVYFIHKNDWPSIKEKLTMKLKELT